MGTGGLHIDPIEELLVAGYLVNPSGEFRHMDDLREWAHWQAKALRRAITEPRRIPSGADSGGLS